MYSRGDLLAEDDEFVVGLNGRNSHSGCPFGHRQQRPTPLIGECSVKDAPVRTVDHLLTIRSSRAGLATGCSVQ